MASCLCIICFIFRNFLVVNLFFFSMTRVRDKSREARDRKRSRELNWALGRSSVLCGVPTSSAVFQVPLHKARYWKKRCLDPAWRSGAVGGHRRGFSLEQEKIIVGEIKRCVLSNPTMSCPLIRQQIFTNTGYQISSTYITAVLAAVDWTYVPFFVFTHLQI